MALLLVQKAGFRLGRRKAVVTKMLFVLLDS